MPTPRFAFGQVGQGAYPRQLLVDVTTAPSAPPPGYAPVGPDEIVRRFCDGVSVGAFSRGRPGVVSLQVLGSTPDRRSWSLGLPALHEAAIGALARMFETNATFRGGVESATLVEVAPLGGAAVDLSGVGSLPAPIGARRLMVDLVDEGAQECALILEFGERVTDAAAQLVGTALGAWLELMGAGAFDSAVGGTSSGYLMRIGRRAPEELLMKAEHIQGGREAWNSLELVLTNLPATVPAIVSAEFV